MTTTEALAGGWVVALFDEYCVSGAVQVPAIDECCAVLVSGTRVASAMGISGSCPAFPPAYEVFGSSVRFSSALNTMSGFCWSVLKTMSGSPVALPLSFSFIQPSV